MRARDMIDLAQRLIEDHRAFDEAAQVLGWAIELDPGSGAHADLALCLLKCGRGEDAIASARAAAAARGDDPRVLNALGLACADQWRESEAMKAFDRAIEVDPTRHEWYMNRGAVAYQFGRYRQCAGDLLRGILVEGRLLAHRLKYSSMELELKTIEGLAAQVERLAREPDAELAEALPLLRLVAEYLEDPGAFPVSAGRGVRFSGELAWAAPVLRFVAERSPMKYARNRRLTRLLDFALVARPDDSAIHWARSEVLTACTKDPRLAADLEFLYRHHPGCEEVRDRWIRHLMVTKDWRRAATVNDVWLEEDPDSTWALENRARICEGRDDYAAALTSWNRIIDLEAEDSPSQAADQEDLEATMHLYLDRARCLERLGHVEDAERDYEKALAFQEAEGDESELSIDVVRLERARFYKEQGRLKDALVDLDHCIEKGTQLPFWYKLRSEVREEMGDRAGAEADRRKAEEKEGEKKKV